MFYKKAPRLAGATVNMHPGDQMQLTTVSVINRSSYDVKAIEVADLVAQLPGHQPDKSDGRTPPPVEVEVVSEHFGNKHLPLQGIPLTASVRVSLSPA